MKKINFIVWCPMAYTESSGGILALHKLCHNLAVMGERSFITTSGKNADYQGEQITTDIAMNFDKESSIVIYPEIVRGNPLNAKYIMRWLLNTPDVIAYSFGEGDRKCNVYYKFAESFNEGNVIGDFGGELRALELHLEKFKNFGKERNGSCFIIKKGENKNWHPKGAIQIDEYEQLGGNAYLSNIFNSSKVFISYDNACFLSVQAALCGCLSIVAPDGQMSAIEWHEKYPYFKYGIAYGLDDIGYALATMHFVKDNLQRLEQITLNQTKEFISRAYSLIERS